MVISDLSSGLRTGRNVLLFSERPVFLRTSGLNPFSAVLEMRLFRVAYELRGMGFGKYFSDRREPPIS